MWSILQIIVPNVALFPQQLTAYTPCSKEAILFTLRDGPLQIDMYEI